MGTINSDIEKIDYQLKIKCEVAKEIYDASVINESLLGLNFRIGSTESGY